MKYDDFIDGTNDVIEPFSFSGEDRLPCILVIPERITKIKTKAFFKCTQFDTLIIDHDIYIDDDAFHKCGIQNIIIKSNFTQIYRSSQFMNSPISMIVISTDAPFHSQICFSGNKYLKTVRVSSCDAVIPQRAFADTNIDKLDISSGTWIDIDDGAFYNTKIKKLELPIFTHVGSRAFEKCNELKKVTCYDSECQIDKFAFRKCKNLKEFIIKPLCEPMNI